MVATKMKIYFDRAHLPDGAAIVPMLRPFASPTKDTDVQVVFDNYFRVASDYIEIVPTLEKADYAVLPGDWRRGYVLREAMNLAEDLAARTRMAEVPLVVFFHGDEEWNVPLRHDLLFRHSLYKSGQASHDFAMPAWNQDILREHMDDHLIIRKKVSRPTIGFCGKASWDSGLFLRFWGKKMIQTLKGQPTTSYAAHPTTLRSRVLSSIKRDNRVNTNFIIHSKYYGGSYVPKLASHNPQKLVKVSKQYARNMIDSDYIICVRGNGNYSVRLYETLSAGRIPVFVNTDCVLPYDFMLNYKKHFIWLESNEIDTIVDRIAEFHENLSESDFKIVQRESRKLYDEYLSPDGFFKNFPRHFAKVGSKQ